MRLLACSLIAVVSVALSGAVFAASEEDHQVTGTIVKESDGTIAVELANKQHFYVKWDTDIPKVGQKVTVHYDVIGRGRLVAHKVEKVGDTEKGSKKR